MVDFKSTRPDFDVAFSVLDSIRVLYCPHVSHPFRRQTGLKRTSLMRVNGFLLTLKRTTRAVSPAIIPARTAHNHLHLTQHTAINIVVNTIAVDLYAELIHAGIMCFLYYIGGARPKNDSESTDSSTQRNNLESAVEFVNVLSRNVHTITIDHVVCVLPTKPLATMCVPKFGHGAVTSNSRNPRVSMAKLCIVVTHGSDDFLNIQTTFQSVLLFQHIVQRQNGAVEEAEQGASQSCMRQPINNQIASYIKAQASKFSLHRETQRLECRVSSEFAKLVQKVVGIIGEDEDSVVQELMQYVGAPNLSAEQQRFVFRYLNDGEFGKTYKSSSLVRVGEITGNVTIAFLQSVLAVRTTRDCVVFCPSVTSCGYAAGDRNCKLFFQGIVQQ